MVVYDDTSASEPVRVYDSRVLTMNPETFGDYQLSYRTGDILSPRIDIGEPLSLEMQDFCNAIRHGTQPRSSIQVGVDVVQAIEAIDQSLFTRGAQTPVAKAPEFAASQRELIRS
jgi:hypothetical protein